MEWSPKRKLLTSTSYWKTRCSPLLSPGKSQFHPPFARLYGAAALYPVTSPRKRFLPWLNHHYCLKFQMIVFLSVCGINLVMNFLPSYYWLFLRLLHRYHQYLEFDSSCNSEFLSKFQISSRSNLIKYLSKKGASLKSIINVKHFIHQSNYFLL